MTVYGQYTNQTSDRTLYWTVTVEDGNSSDCAVPPPELLEVCWLLSPLCTKGNPFLRIVQSNVHWMDTDFRYLHGCV